MTPNNIKIAIELMDDMQVSNGTIVRVNHLLEVMHDEFAITAIACTNEDVPYLERWNDVRVIGTGTRPLKYRSSGLLMMLCYIMLWNIRLLKVLLQNAFDIVLCAYDPLGFPAVYITSKIKKFKVIYEAHSIISLDAREKGYNNIILNLVRFLERFIVVHSDFVIALSQNTMESYSKYSHNIDLVPVFIDTDVFHANHKPRDCAKKVIGLIGPFRPDDIRQRDTLETLYAQIDEFDARISFLIVGFCENRIESNRITYTGYLKSEEEYVECLQSLDAVLVIERVASYGPLNKIIEPMSCSVPIFATPKAMIGLYWMEADHDLMICEESAMVSRINQLIFDDMRMNEIRQNARQKIERYYSKKSNQKQLLKIIRSLT